MVATGVVTSILAHELGHALYLKSQGKNFNLSTSLLGFAVHTNDYLTEKQYRNFGLSGFAFQAGIGTLLTTFESTKNYDFTKGWVVMNNTQLCTYEHRRHDIENDFALIERGNGDKRLNFGVLASISQYNLTRIEIPNPIPFYSADIEKIRRAPSTWYFDTVFIDKQAELISWVLPKENELFPKQVVMYDTGYLSLHRKYDKKLFIASSPY